MGSLKKELIFPGALRAPDLLNISFVFSNQFYVFSLKGAGIFPGALRGGGGSIRENNHKFSPRVIILLWKKMRWRKLVEKRIYNLYTFLQPFSGSFQSKNASICYMFGRAYRRS